MNTFDPRAKLSIVIALSSLAIIVKDIRLAVFIAAVSLAISMMLSPSIFNILVKLRRIIPLLLILGLSQLLFNKTGTQIFQYYSILITDAGLKEGILVILRMLIIITSALILATESAGSMMTALSALKLPYEIVFMVYIGIKFLPIFNDEFKNSLLAVQLAGADLKAHSLKDKLQVYVYIATPAVVSALNRAKKIAIAAECRGFRAYPHRTFLNNKKLELKDYIAILSVVILFTAAVLFNKQLV